MNKSYIEGFVIPVTPQNKDAYAAMAREAAPMFLEHGATRVVECWGDDVPHGKTTDFYGAVKAQDGESVVFSWISWPSKEARDAGNKKVMEDPRMQPPANMPFDGRRMIMGGFETMVDTGGDATSKLMPCLWFTNQAEEAAQFYVSVLPDSRIDHVQRSPTDYPAGKAGDVLVVEFTLAGQRFMALNGGERFEFNPSVSMKIDCADQAEVDRVWDRLSAGGSPMQCGWLKDRYGLCWQIVPTVLPRYLSSSDRAAAARAMQAMMGMVKLDIEGLRRAYEGQG